MAKKYTKQELKNMSSQQRWNIRHRNIIRQSEHKYFLKNKSVINYKNKMRNRRTRAKEREMTN